MENIVIVESPTKVKTIQKYLGKDYKVMSSKGHIRDLPKKDLGVDVEHDFEPMYTIMPGKEKVAKELKGAVKDAHTVYLATDLDREGEAISWHVRHLLEEGAKKKSKSKKKTAKSKKSDLEFKRVVFHEITKNAIQEAFEHPREINYDLVDAYQARRVLDRIVGYKLSPLLWEKIRYGLSAGRVQSVVVRLIVERERERENFNSNPYHQFNSLLKTKKGEEVESQLSQFEGKSVEKKITMDTFVGEYTYTTSIFDDEQKAAKLQKEFAKHHFQVKSVDDKTVTRKAQPPLTTARLQRQGVNRFGFTSKRTMSAAQKLYEAGFITYHRTDSVFLSEEFVKNARTFITKKYGKEYLPEKAVSYSNKSKSAQEAHEAIRPSDVTRDMKHADVKKLKDDERKVYELIWRNAVASQMSPAELRQLRIDIVSDSNKTKLDSDPQCEWRANGSVMVFPGWMKAMGKAFTEKLLPDVSEKELLEAKEVNKTDHETSPPPRYTEASLIKDLEKFGIGRPSTYAPVISTVLGRKYVIKDGRYFIPEATGIVVNDLLVKHFPDIVDLDFTAEMEDSLDKIAHGKQEWVPVIRDFYGPFEKTIVKKKKEIKKEDIVVLEKTDETCPECGKPLVIKLGRYGKFLSCSGFPDCEYAAPLNEEGNGVLEGAQEDLGKCPEDDGNLILKEGRFGKFIACSNYPKCKYTQNYQDTIGMKCPDCGEGEVVKKKTKKGILFYGCSRYPDCKYSSWKDPREQNDQEGSDE